MVSMMIQALFNFNPRLREGGDKENPEYLVEQYHISIHASAKEATHPPYNRGSRFPYFNPRLREGGDSIDY